MNEKQSALINAEQEVDAAMPVVQAFTHYYETQGPNSTDGLIAGLIAYKQQLDRNGEPIQ